MTSNFDFQLSEIFKSKRTGDVANDMQKLCIFVSMMAFSYAGWFLGTLTGFGFMTSFFLSGTFSLVGVYTGWWTFRRFFY